MYTTSMKKEKRFSLLKKSFLMTLGIAFTFFIGTKVYPYIHGPVLEIDTLSNGVTLYEPMISLTGVSKYTKNLFINGVPIELAPNGTFSEKIILSPGYNIITTEATDQFGSRNETVYQLVLHENDNRTFTLNTLPESNNSLRKN